MTRERIHEIGAHRHGGRWIFANQRAVEIARATGLEPSGETERLAIPAIVLKVLDGEKLDTGFIWSKESDKWIPRQAKEVADRLMGVEQE